MQHEFDDLVERARQLAIDDRGQIDRRTQVKLAAEMIAGRLDGRDHQVAVTLAASEIARRRVEATRRRTRLQFNSAQQKWTLLDPYCHITIAPGLDVLVRDAVSRDFLAWRDRRRKIAAKHREQQEQVDDLVTKVLTLMPDDDTKCESILFDLLANIGGATYHNNEDDADDETPDD